MLLLFCNMKFLLSLFNLTKKKERKTLADNQRELLVNLGGAQFKKLIELGLGIPVRLA